jgi:hypothetical protein
MNCKNEKKIVQVRLFYNFYFFSFEKLLRLEIHFQDFFSTNTLILDD